MSDKAGKESQFMFSHPELDSNPSIGSNWESGRDKLVWIFYGIMCILDF